IRAFSGALLENELSDSGRSQSNCGLILCCFFSRPLEELSWPRGAESGGPSLWRCCWFIHWSITLLTTLHVFVIRLSLRCTFLQDIVCANCGPAFVRGDARWL